jgi:uncharacterized protein
MTEVSTNLSEKRIELIDVLRGFALLGIIITHFIDQYFGGPLPVATNYTTADLVLKKFVEVFVDGKFYSIFSFLFGISFSIQLARASDNKFISRFVWRLAILFGIGFLHLLHYRADILSTYALIGFALVLSYRLPTKYLFIIALIFAFNIPANIYHAIKRSSPTVPVTELVNSALAGPSNEQVYFNTLKHGTYSEILKANAKAFLPRLKLRLWTGRIFIIYGLFILGYLVGKHKLFERIDQHTQVIRRVLFGSLSCFIVCFTLGTVSALQFAGGIFSGFLMDAANLMMAMTFVCLVTLGFSKVMVRKKLMPLYAVGRMGLTNYLMQTFFGCVIFFGFDFLGEVSRVQAFFIAIAVFVLQIVFSQVWLKYFRYGFFEWLWRSLTFFKLFKLKRGE